MAFCICHPAGALSWIHSTLNWLATTMPCRLFLSLVCHSSRIWVLAPFHGCFSARYFRSSECRSVPTNRLHSINFVIIFSFSSFAQITWLCYGNCGRCQLPHDLCVHQNVLQSRVVAIDTWRHIVLRLAGCCWVIICLRSALYSLINNECICF